MHNSDLIFHHRFQTRQMKLMLTNGQTDDRIPVPVFLFRIVIFGSRTRRRLLELESANRTVFVRIGRVDDELGEPEQQTVRLAVAGYRRIVGKGGAGKEIIN